MGKDTILHLLIGGIILVSCSDPIKDELPYLASVPVTFSFHVNPMEGETGTKGDVLFPNELSIEEESQLKDLTVFQFDGNGDRGDKMIVVRYIEGNFDKAVTVGLMQPKTDIDKQQHLVFVANTNSVLSTFSGTYGDLCDKLIRIEADQAATGGIIMEATKDIAITNSLSSQSIVLTRLMAKIKFSYDISQLPTNEKFVPSKLQLFRVPLVYSLGTTSVPYPAGNQDDFDDYPYTMTGMEEGYTWYMPENCRGTGFAITEKDKTGETGIAPTGQEAYCSYVELTGVYTKNGADRMVSYKCYLGNDNTSDYNVKRNHVYQVHLSLKGVNTVDKRITVTEFPEAPTEGANCYMIAPDEGFCFNPYLPAGVDISTSSITYAGRVGSDKSSSKIQSVGIYWQTTSGLLSEVMYLQEKGVIFVKGHPTKTGNALIAAYSGPGQTGKILWSWHIWVTDYRPNATPVTGGSIDTYGSNNFTWMDRNLGATHTYKYPNSPAEGDPDIGNTYGFIYQFGRKDPFPGCDGKSSTVIPLYKADGVTRLNLNPTKADDSDVGYDANSISVTTSIENPLLFSGANIWISAHSESWWSIARNNGNKTVFDPCPAGWCVPYSKNGARAFAGLQGTKYPSSWGNKGSELLYNSGYWFNKVAWYPTPGWRIGTNVAKAGVTGFWYAADQKTSSLYYQLVIESNSVAYGENHPGYGFSIRCIKK